MQKEREDQDETPRYRRASQAHLRAPNQDYRSISPAKSLGVVSEHDDRSMKTGDSQISLQLPSRPLDDDDEDAYEAAAQDIVEIWFPGCHAVSIVESYLCAPNYFLKAFRIFTLHIVVLISINLPSQRTVLKYSTLNFH